MDLLAAKDLSLKFSKFGKKNKRKRRRKVKRITKEQ